MRVFSAIFDIFVYPSADDYMYVHVVIVNVQINEETRMFLKSCHSLSVVVIKIQHITNAQRIAFFCIIDPRQLWAEQKFSLERC